jgi:hypothetical protein
MSRLLGILRRDSARMMVAQVEQRTRPKAVCSRMTASRLTCTRASGSLNARAPSADAHNAPLPVVETLPVGTISARR